MQAQGACALLLAHRSSFHVDGPSGQHSTPASAVLLAPVLMRNLRSAYPASQHPGSTWPCPSRAHPAQGSSRAKSQTQVDQSLGAGPSGQCRVRLGIPRGRRPAPQSPGAPHQRYLAAPCLPVVKTSRQRGRHSATTPASASASQAACCTSPHVVGVARRPRRGNALELIELGQHSKDAEHLSHPLQDSPPSPRSTTRYFGDFLRKKNEPSHVGPHEAARDAVIQGAGLQEPSASSEAGGTFRTLQRIIIVCASDLLQSACLPDLPPGLCLLTSGLWRSLPAPRSALPFGSARIMKRPTSRSRSGSRR